MFHSQEPLECSKGLSIRRRLEKEKPPNPEKETPAGQLANVWDNNSAFLQRNNKSEKDRRQ